jgi:sugar-phosphatase
MPLHEPQHVGALLFDMDGVLIDSEPLWRRAEIEIFGDVGLPLTESDCERTQGLRIDEAVGYWFARAPWPGTSCEDVARAIVDRVAGLIGKEGKPLPGVHRSLEIARAQGWRLGLASSSPAFLIETVLDRFGLQDAFEATHSAQSEPFGKPHPAVYLSTAASMGIDPSHCVAIEDSVNGVISAIAARMRCIAIPAPENGRDPRFAIATRRLASLETLDEALNELMEESCEP